MRSRSHFLTLSALGILPRTKDRSGIQTEPLFSAALREPTAGSGTSPPLGRALLPPTRTKPQVCGSRGSIPAPSPGRGQRIPGAGPAGAQPGGEVLQGDESDKCRFIAAGSWERRQQRARRTRPRVLPAPSSAPAPPLPHCPGTPGIATRAGWQRGPGRARRSRRGRSELPPPPPRRPGCSVRAGATPAAGRAPATFPELEPHWRSPGSTHRPRRSAPLRSAPSRPGPARCPRSARPGPAAPAPLGRPPAHHGAPRCEWAAAESLRAGQSPGSSQGTPRPRPRRRRAALPCFPRAVPCLHPSCPACVHPHALRASPVPRMPRSCPASIPYSPVCNSPFFSTGIPSFCARVPPPVRDFVLSPMHRQPWLPRPCHADRGALGLPCEFPLSPQEQACGVMLRMSRESWRWRARWARSSPQSRARGRLRAWLPQGTRGVQVPAPCTLVFCAPGQRVLPWPFPTQLPAVQFGIGDLITVLISTFDTQIFTPKIAWRVQEIKGLRDAFA